MTLKYDIKLEKINGFYLRLLLQLSDLFKFCYVK